MGLLSKFKSFFFSKKFLINLGLIIILYIAIISLSNWYLGFSTDHGEKINVPELVGKNEKEVAQIVQQLGLEYEISESVYDPSKPEGTVLAQDPVPTSQSTTFVKEGRIIRLKISKKTQLVEVPNCVDKSERFAENILKSRGLKCKVEYRPSVEAVGAVLQQLHNGKQVEEKEKVAIGSTITIIVGRSEGGEALMIPNLMDMTICDVKSRLALMPNVQLIVNCNDCVTHADSCAARVFSQSPEFIEGGIMPAGSSIVVHATK
jgi:eukaryotic-like serine/threonine-protein kinase